MAETLLSYKAIPSFNFYFAGGGCFCRAAIKPADACCRLCLPSKYGCFESRLDFGASAFAQIRRILNGAGKIEKHGLSRLSAIHHYCVNADLTQF
jgi:hypothetical protein